MDDGIKETMELTTTGNSIDLNLLSPRERSVVELAVQGKIDEQIAQSLDLSVSTIASYWVRIRGKVGQLSRVEIVAGVLQHHWEERYARLDAERERLASEAIPMRAACARAESALEAMGGVGWSLLALERLPTAVLVAREPGMVSYANPEALRALQMEATSLLGRPLWELSVGANDAAWEGAIRRLFADSEASSLRTGNKKPHYLRRGDKTNFRATFVAETFETREGRMAVVTFGPYLGELESFVQAIRQPFSLE